MQQPKLLIPMILVSLLLLGGCSHWSMDRATGDQMQADMAELLKTITPRQSVNRAAFEGVRVPRNAPWLASRYDAQYAFSAKQAFEAVLQGHPVVFNLRTDNNPLVRSPTGATTVMQHLNAISTQADWSYSVDDGVVLVTDHLTENFLIESIPGIGVSRMDLDGQGEAITNSLELTTIPYVELENALLSIATDYLPDDASGDREIARGMFSLVPSSSSLIATGRPSMLRRIGEIVSEFNASVGQKVHVVITLFDVAFTDSSQRSIDFVAMRRAAIASMASLDGSSMITSLDGGLSLGLDFLEGNSIDGTSIVFYLLRQQGQTSVRLHEAFEVTNNIPFSIEEHRSYPYVSEVSLARSDGGSISQITPEVQTDIANTGLGFHVLASVANNTINLRLNISQSDLVRFESYDVGFGDQSISGKLPITDRQNRVIPITLQDGETRLIANLTQSGLRNDRTSGGLLSSSGLEETLSKQTVIAVTAKIL